MVRGWGPRVDWWSPGETPKDSHIVSLGERKNNPLRHHEARVRVRKDADRQTGGCSREKTASLRHRVPSLSLCIRAWDIHMVPRFDAHHMR